MSLGDLEKNAEPVKQAKGGGRVRLAAIPSLIFVIYYLAYLFFPAQVAVHISDPVHAGILILGAVSFLWLAYELLRAQKG